MVDATDNKEEWSKRQTTVQNPNSRLGAPIRTHDEPQEHNKPTHRSHARIRIVQIAQLDPYRTSHATSAPSLPVVAHPASHMPASTPDPAAPAAAVDAPASAMASPPAPAAAAAQMAASPSPAAAAASTAGVSAAQSSAEPIAPSAVPAPLVEHRPLVVCGPSGVGKGTLLSRLLREHPDLFAKSVSHTTRPPRAGEVGGTHYHFTTPERLLDQVKQGKFIEHACVHGNYYGTSIDSVSAVMASGRVCLLEIDIQGVQAVRRVPSLAPRTIFVRAPTFGDLADRLTGRGSENAETLNKRLDTARAEMDFFYTNRHIFEADLINDDVERAYLNLIEQLHKLYPQLNLLDRHHCKHGHKHAHHHQQK